MHRSREEIYVREIKGRYASWRWVCVWLTQLLFYGLRWLAWNERQAVPFNLGTRKFYLFGIDGVMLASPSQVKLQDTESLSVPVTVRIAYGKGVPESNQIMFELKAVDDASVRVKEKASFFVLR